MLTPRICGRVLLQEIHGDEADYTLAVRRIHKMVEQLEETYPSERILVGGFSQGGMCAPQVQGATASVFGTCLF